LLQKQIVLNKVKYELRSDIKQGWVLMEIGKKIRGYRLQKKFNLKQER
jgi:hypothetical protein